MRQPDEEWFEKGCSDLGMEASRGTVDLQKSLVEVGLVYFLS